MQISDVSGLSVVKKNNNIKTTAIFLSSIYLIPLKMNRQVMKLKLLTL